MKSQVLEHNVGSISLTCSAQSNPPAQMMWLEESSGEIVQYGEMLEFSPVLKQHQGSYHCLAQNKVGNSSFETFHLNVVYPPVIESITPQERMVASVGSSKVLRCGADANPPPQYQWLHKMDKNGEVNIVGRTRNLELLNIGYRESGEYICRASNIIDDEERVTESEIVKVKVEGQPELLDAEPKIVSGVGDDVVMSVLLCSDPPPDINTWQWGGGMVLSAGAQVDRYRAEMEPHPSLDQCYHSKLIIARADQQDSKEYVVRAENDRGMDMVSMMLLVEGKNIAQRSCQTVIDLRICFISDSLSMTSVIVVTISLLLIFLILVIIITLLYNKKRLCCQGK